MSSVSNIFVFILTAKPDGQACISDPPTKLWVCLCFLASGPATPDSAESVAQHLSPESSRKAYWRTWDSQSAQHTSSNVFNDSTLPSHTHLKSPATGRTRSVSDSSAPRRGTEKHTVLLCS